MSERNPISKLLLSARYFGEPRPSNPLRSGSNSLEKMGKPKDPASILAANLARYMKAKGVNSEPALEKLSGVSQKTINNILKKRHDPYFSSVNKLSAALGIETYPVSYTHLRAHE